MSKMKKPGNDFHLVNSAHSNEITKHTQRKTRQQNLWYDTDNGKNYLIQVTDNTTHRRPVKSNGLLHSFQSMKISGKMGFVERNVEAKLKNSERHVAEVP